MSQSGINDICCDPSRRWHGRLRRWAGVDFFDYVRWVAICSFLRSLHALSGRMPTAPTIQTPCARSRSAMLASGLAGSSGKAAVDEWEGMGTGREWGRGSRGRSVAGGEEGEEDVPIGSAGIKDWHDLILDCPQWSISVGCRPPSMNHQEVEHYRPEFTLLVAGSRGGPFGSALHALY